MKKARRVVVWFRKDLRIHDNEALQNAISKGDEVIPIYIFDEREFKGQTSFGFKKTGKFRAKFTIEAVEDLRNSFKNLGINLLVRVGKPEQIIPSLCIDTEAAWVFCNIERTDEEIKVQDALEQNLWNIGKELYYSRGKMLYYTQDLPFPISQTPDIFTHFRKEVEKIVPVREPLPAPSQLSPWTFRVDTGDMPTLSDFGHEEFTPDPRTVLSFKGGETAALQRLNYYLWESNNIATYKETRNGMVGGDYSSKLSPWLGLGCISPKTIYYEIKRYEKERKKNKSTYWLYFELLWRDFFRLMGKKHKNNIFKKGGTSQNMDINWRDDRRLFAIWSEGKTGVPFIDANMKELNLTGFMSNRGRQNVASFLVKDLRVNWQIGAEYFESLLIDYDVCSNYGNWNYIAGVGSDPRENRYFNILSQARRYDPQGEYVKLWLPELQDLPSSKVHQPDKLTREEQKSHKVFLGGNYPMAVVATRKWG